MTLAGVGGIVLALVLAVTLRRRTRRDDRLSPHGLEALGRVTQAVVERPGPTAAQLAEGSPDVGR